MGTKIKNLVFDLGLVLLDWNREYLFGPYFNDKEKCDWFLSNVCDYAWNNSHDDGTPYAPTIVALKEKFPEWSKEIQMYYDEWTRTMGEQIPGMQEVLEELKARGYRLYALSNWSSETFYQIANRYPVLRLMDGYLISGDIGYLKPGKDIFRYFLEKYDLKASECLFVDDTLKNVEGCKAAGIDAVQFTGADAYRSELVRRGIL